MSADEHQRYRFGPLERRGLIGSLRPAQVVLIATSLTAGVVLMRSLPGGMGVASALALALLTVTFCVAAILRPRFSMFEPLLAPGIDVSAALGTTLALAMWLYSGYFEVSTVAEEIEDPARSIPRALLIVTPIVVLSYALPTMAGLLASGGWAEWRSGQFTTIGQELGGPVLGTWLFLGSAASQAVVFLTYVLWWSRLSWAMAREGQLPRALARLRAGGQRMAIVGTLTRPLGLATLKDLLEEISGDLAGW